MQKITTFLWFDNHAEEAVNFYTSIFKNSSIDKVARFGDSGPGPKGSVMTIAFRLQGQEFVALNGGPIYQFTPAISLVVNCESQTEVDYYWNHLVAGGKPVQCGWLQDKYGLSWQIVPTALPDLLMDSNQEKAARVTQAMMKMIKLDIAELKRAFDGK